MKYYLISEEELALIERAISISKSKYRDSLFSEIRSRNILNDTNIEKDIKEKFNQFIENQIDIPKKYISILNDNFWDLL
jgi:hypothetical protein